MRPTKTDECNVTLTLPGGTEDNDLPAVRAMLYDASRGQTPQDGAVGFQTFWDPDETERLAIAAGAPVRLTLWGPGHPPVAMGVEAGSEDVANGLLSVKRVGRALAAFYAQLRDERWPDEEGQSKLPPPTPSEFMDLWDRVFDQVAEADAADRELADQLLTAATAGIDPEAVAAEVAGEIPAPDTGLGDPGEGICGVPHPSHPGVACTRAPHDDDDGHTADGPPGELGYGWRDRGAPFPRGPAPDVSDAPTPDPGAPDA